MKPSTLFRALTCASALIALPAVAELPVVTAYKDPNCGCCGGWAEHMRAAGFAVKEVPSAQMAQIKRQLGVPETLGSCHTAQVGQYIVEGHVPAADVKRLLAEAPAGARGLAAPGMPLGSPGMEAAQSQRYDVIRFNADGSSAVFAQH
ncbi:MAG: DUF411 domain-containing protein [Rhodocyclaceae bacterium]|nr:DUF411 domain-containing protein [Rhodocyclaceae bacterium]